MSTSPGFDHRALNGKTFRHELQIQTDDLQASFGDASLLHSPTTPDQCGGTEFGANISGLPEHAESVTDCYALLRAALSGLTDSFDFAAFQSARFGWNGATDGPENGSAPPVSLSGLAPDPAAADQSDSDATTANHLVLPSDDDIASGSSADRPATLVATSFHPGFIENPSSLIEIRWVDQAFQWANTPPLAPEVRWAEQPLQWAKAPVELDCAATAGAIMDSGARTGTTLWSGTPSDPTPAVADGGYPLMSAGISPGLPSGGTGDALPFPMSSVCYILDTTLNRQGTGVIIGPHTILTAAHVVWDADTNQAGTSFQINPGYFAIGGNVVAGGTGIFSPIADLHFFPVNDKGEMLNGDAVQQDFAVIDVSADLSQYGSFGHFADFAGGNVMMSGYPGLLGGILETTSGTVEADPNFSILDNVTLTPQPGQSGGPLWIDQGTAANPQPFVVGLVSTSASALQLTMADWQTIDNWIESDAYLWGGDDFSSGTTRTGEVWVNGGPSAAGNIETAGDSDMFAVQLTAGTSYRFDVLGSLSGDGTLAAPHLVLTDSWGNVLRGASPMQGHDAEVFFTPQKSGTFFVDVSSDSGTGTGTYKVEATTDDFASDARTLGTIGLGQPAHGTIELAGDTDWFAIQLKAGVGYQFNLDGVQRGGGTLNDPFLSILSVGNNNKAVTLAFDDNTLSGPDSEIYFKPTSSGIYFVQAGGMQNSNSTGIGTYTAHVYQDDYAGDGSTTGVVTFKSYAVGTANGTLENTGDSDWFAVSLTKGVSYRIDVSGSNSGGGTLQNPSVSLYDHSGAAIAGGTNTGPGGDPELYFTPQTSGTYFVAAESYSQDGKGLTGSYTVHVTQDDYAANTSTNGHFTFSAYDPYDGSASGTIEVAGDHDWFKIGMTAGQQYTFDLTGTLGGGGTLGDPVERIYDSSGKQVAQAGTSGADPELSFTPTTSGSYYVDVSSSAPVPAPNTPVSVYGPHDTGTYHLAVHETVVVHQHFDLI